MPWEGGRETWWVTVTWAVSPPLDRYNGTDTDGCRLGRAQQGQWRQSTVGKRTATGMQVRRNMGFRMVVVSSWNIPEHVCILVGVTQEKEVETVISHSVWYKCLMVPGVTLSPMPLLLGAGVKPSSAPPRNSPPFGPSQIRGLQFLLLQGCNFHPFPSKGLGLLKEIFVNCLLTVESKLLGYGRKFPSILVQRPYRWQWKTQLNIHHFILFR